MGDIKAFLGNHVKELKEDIGPAAVQLVVNRDGRPSGWRAFIFLLEFFLRFFGWVGGGVSLKKKKN